MPFRSVACFVGRNKGIRAVIGRIEETSNELNSDGSNCGRGKVVVQENE